VDNRIPATAASDPEPAPTPGFPALLAVRVLTVLNDNLARWLVIGLGKRAAAAVGTAPAAVLAVGTVVYVLPFMLFAWLAGWLADRFAKRSIVIGGKFAEILIGLAAAAAVAWGAGAGPVLAGIPLGLWLLLGVVGLFGLQTTLLNPSLLGTIPETVPAAKLSSANGIFALVSLAATLAGMAAGNWLADMTWLSPVPDPDRPLPGWLLGLPLGFVLPAAAGLVTVATAGWLLSLWLPTIPAADPRAKAPFNALAKTVADLRQLLSAPRLAGAAAGIVFFWAIAAVAQLNVDQYAFESGATTQGQVVPLLLALVCGIGAGSLLAGRLSRQGIDPDSQVNLGLVPVGGLLMTVACIALACSSTAIFTVTGSLPSGLAAAVCWLFVLGVGAGMFDVPLEAYLQEQCPPARLGATLAATNLLVFTGMLIASIGYYGLRLPVGEAELTRPLFSARGVFGLFAVCAALATVAAVLAAPRSSLRLLVASFVQAICRFRIRDEFRLPAVGPALIVANHLSWLDGFLVVLASRRPVRMVVYGPNIRGRLLNRLAVQWRFILFEPRPKSIARALRAIEQGLAEGDLIGIFCEGGISRTGQLLGFRRGLGHILDRANAPAVPLAIDGLWGSIFSFSEGRFFAKWPRSRRRWVTMRFGPPLPVGAAPSVIRLALQETLAEAVHERLTRRGNGRQGGDSAAAATAEAFDGCCLLRRNDRFLASLAPGDPLHDSLGSSGPQLLRLAGSVAAADMPTEELLATLARGRTTVWLARPDQLAAAAAVTLDFRPPEVVVVPLAAAAELPAVQSLITAFAARFGVEPVVAYAPPGCGLLAMNTPASRGQPQEVTCKPDTVGRVVNGAVIWPRVSQRAEAHRGPLPEAAVAPPSPAPDVSLAIAATIAGNDGLGWTVLPERFDVDDDGFLRLRLEAPEERCMVSTACTPSSIG
jgi:acyl-[acyl-carrier-protein]-phospholipid O-acyltransferase/long-chain-fatty-acid--[acyl-carrier-protein] ligase